MALTPGTRLGPYHVLARIGEGGMGEVYRATDTKLKRQVALKILPASLASDPDRLARFQREAEVLASLNHPNIAAIYGLEDAGSTTALVMELIEGPTLADVIAHGGVPVHDALPIARQIAEALEAAHEQGIIHRDLKPANIKVRGDGTVKVLDFGLAKAIDPASAFHSSAGQALSQSPTITTPAMTQTGMILGTAAYMSPEQARGKPVDKRADIWAFGCVLYEMLTGRRAFGGETVTETLAAVLERPVDWTTLPASTPANVRTVLRHAFEKDPKRRLHDIADARIQLDDTLLATPPVSSDVATRNVTPRWLMALGATAIVVGAAAWYLGSRQPSTSPPDSPVTRLVLTPEGTFPTGAETVLTLSPDGRRLAYAAAPNGVSRLFLRELDQFESKAIPGTEGATDPAFSPDGNWIAFVAAGKIKKVTPMGDGLVTLSETQSDRSLSLSWESNDSILFSPTRATGIWRLSAAGGAPSPVTTLQEGELSHRSSAILPGGKSLLFSTGEGLGTGSIVVAQSLETGKRSRVGSGAGARYISTGHLLYTQRGSLFAVPFDPARIEVRGSPMVVLQGIREAVGGTPQFAVSRTGSIAYVPADHAESQSALVWVDRAGMEHPTFATGLDFSRPRLAPDGHRVAVAIGSGLQGQNLGDIWVLDLTREIRNRLTTNGHSTFPAWSPDGRLALSSDRGDGQYQLHVMGFSGAGSDVELPTNRGTNYAFSWSPDSQFVATVSVSPATANDIWVLPVDNPAQGRPFVQTPRGEGAPAFSPDGRWIAYASDHSGRSEIYMRPFPGPGEEVTISSGGGNEPVWVRKTAELFYRQDDAMMVVSITTTPTVSVGKPRRLFERAYIRSNSFWPNYDVSPDGQRVLMVKGTGLEAPSRINVVLNWAEELKRQVATK